MYIYILSYCTLLTDITECILRKTGRGRAGLPQLPHHRSPAWIWDQCLEVSAHASDPDAVCNPRWSESRSPFRQKVTLMWCHTMLISTNSWYRFRSVPTFGQDTIRKLPKSVSDLNKLAAHDYEDILQVCLFCHGPSIASWSNISAQYQPLMGSFGRRITRVSAISSSYSPHGTHMLNSTCTWTQL